MMSPNVKGDIHQAGIFQVSQLLRWEYILKGGGSWSELALRLSGVMVDLNATPIP